MHPTLNFFSFVWKNGSFFFFLNKILEQEIKMSQTYIHLVKVEIFQ